MRSHGRAELLPVARHGSLRKHAGRRGIGNARIAHTGKRICYPCADRDTRENMRVTDKVVAYVSADGRQVTTWTGGLLGNTWNVRIGNKRYGTFGPTSRVYVNVTDLYGGEWYGSGPHENGQYVTLHRRKGPAGQRSKANATVPLDFPVIPLTTREEKESATDLVTCGNCKRSWDDAVPTSWTPAPSARCPFEYFH